MCNPLAIGAALMVAGTAAQYKAQSDRERDMRRLNRAETERQDKYYAGAKGYLDENQATYERSKVEGDMAAAAADRQAQHAAADRNAPRANTPLPGSAGGNSVVADAFKQALAGAAAEASARGAAKAELASFGDFMNDAAVKTGRNSDQIGMYGSFSRGSANVLPLELNYAATRRRSAATIGNILTAIGGAMMGGGGGGLLGGMNSVVGAGSGAMSGAGAAAAGGAASGLFSGLGGG